MTGPQRLIRTATWWALAVMVALAFLALGAAMGRAQTTTYVTTAQWNSLLTYVGKLATSVNEQKARLAALDSMVNGMKGQIESLSGVDVNTVAKLEEQRKAINAIIDVELDAICKWNLMQDWLDKRFGATPVPDPYAYISSSVGCPPAEKPTPPPMPAKLP